MPVYDTAGEHCQCKESGLPKALTTILETRKIPNALLLLGNPGIGKQDAALQFARTANCQGEGPSKILACNRCKSCKKMIAGMHPDIIRVAPVKGSIRIAQIRELYGAITVKPHEAQFRMILIQDADTMNPEGSNALLKILEEPPERTFFVLTAATTDTLLQTILSRCRQVRFKPASLESIRKTLVDAHHIDPAMARVAASWSDGSLNKALRLLNLSADSNGTDWIKRRLWLITETAALIKGGNQSDRTALLLLAEKIGREPELLKDSLAIIRTFFRDIAVFGHNPDTIVNIDFSPLLQDIVRIEPVQQALAQNALEWLTELHRVEKKIKANAGVRLTLEAFFLKLIPARQTA
ncbi:MAG: DNA polymerase III subunit delta' [Desulfobacterium sp.]|nr:DNA polymerase III subunit delta' [Desulfobacterium sp.]